MITTKFNEVETSTAFNIVNNYSEHKCFAWVKKSFNRNMQVLTVTIQYKSFAQ
jgi:hypothetical protein